MHSAGPLILLKLSTGLQHRLHIQSSSKLDLRTSTFSFSAFGHSASHSSAASVPNTRSSAPMYHAAGSHARESFFESAFAPCAPVWMGGESGDNRSGGYSVGAS